MDEKEWMEKLRQEGFREVYVWDDKPDHEYPNHEHATTTAHVVIRGRMFMEIGEETKELRAGSRFDIPAHAVHSVRIGPEGCRYVVGE